MYACLRRFSGHCVSKISAFSMYTTKAYRGLVTFSSSDTGTRYLPKQLIGEEAVNRTSDAILYGTITIIAAGSSLACRCTNPPILWHAAAQLDLLVAPSIALRC